jgi:hypothetical protein
MLLGGTLCESRRTLRGATWDIAWKYAPVLSLIQGPTPRCPRWGPIHAAPENRVLVPPRREFVPARVDGAYFTTSGFTVEPTAAVKGRGAAKNRNS